MDDGGDSTAANDDGSNPGEGVDPPSTPSPASVPHAASESPSGEVRDRAARGIRSWVRGAARGLRRAGPYGIIALLTASAVAPVLSPALEAGEELGAVLDQLGGMGSGYLGDVLADTADRLRGDGESGADSAPLSESVLREAIAEALGPLIAAGDEQGRAMRVEITGLLRSVDAVSVALTEASGEVRTELTSAIALLGGRFDELRALLTETQRQLAALAGAQRQQTDLVLRALFEATAERRRGASAPRHATDERTVPRQPPAETSIRPLANPAEPDAQHDRPDDDRVPYPGLGSFRTQDAAWFFGREALVTRLLSDLAERLTTGDPLVLVGDSGAGKSSLLAAGLLPAVAEGGLPIEGSSQWPWLTMTPGRSPLTELVGRTAALAGVSAVQAIAEIRATPTAFGALAAQAAAMIGSAAQRRSLAGGRLLIVVDQLEELFTQCTDPVERGSFVTALTSADPALVVMAVRADFYPDCLRLDRLAAVFAGGQVSMPVMRTAELRSVITQPAALAGIALEPGLVELLVAELRDHGLRPGSGALPLLAHALRATWLRGGGRRMTVADYAATGGIDGAVADTAEEIHRELDDTGRRTLRIALLTMVSLADGDRPVRRSAPRDGVPGWLLDRLIAARLVTVSGHTVELAHEILLSAWPRLADWVRQDRAGLVIRRHLGESVRYWHESGEDAGALYRAGRLVTALEWAADREDLSDGERRFLAASVTAEEHGRQVQLRNTRRLRASVGGLTVLLIVALVAGSTAWGLRTEAEAQRGLAVSRQLAAESTSVLEVDPRQAMLSALAAWRIEETSEARGALISARMSDYAGRYGAQGPESGLSMDVSAATELVAIGRRDGVLDVFDATTRQPIGGDWSCHTGDVFGAEFSPDGMSLVTASLEADGLCVWDTSDRQARLVRRLPGLGVVGWHPDGNRIASVGATGLAVWDSRSGEVVAELATDAPAGSLAFSPDGERLAAGFPDGTGLLWEVASDGAVTNLGDHPTPGAGEEATTHLVMVAYSPTGMLATYGADGVILLREGDSGVVSRELRETGPATSSALSFSPDGTRLAATGAGNEVRIWSVDTGTWEPVEIQVGTPRDVAWLSDVDLVVTTFDWGTIRRNVTRRWLRAGAEPLLTAGFSASGDRLITSDTAGTIDFWDPVQGSMARPSITGNGTPSPVATSPQGDYAVGLADGTVELHDSTGDSLQRLVTDPGLPIGELRFSPDGTMLVAQVSGAGPFADQRIWLWHLDDPEAPIDREFPGLSRLDFTADGAGLIRVGSSIDSTEATYVVEELSTEDLARRRSLGGGMGTIYDLTVRSDGRTFLTAAEDGRVQEWTMSDGAPVGTVVQNPAAIRQLAMSPDDRFLATISPQDTTIRLWDAISGDLLANLPGHLAELNAVAFSPDGTQLAGLGATGEIGLWRLDVDGAIREICSALEGPDLPRQWAALDVDVQPCP